MSATIIPFESRAEKAVEARGPASIGPRPRIRSARLLCVGSAIYGFTIAAAIEADTMLIAIALIVAGLFLVRRIA